MMTSLKISAMASAHGQHEFLIHGNDAAERRLLVRRKRLVPRFAQARALSHAAWVHVFENRQGGCVIGKLGDQRGSGGQVQNVVVRKFLAVQLLEIIVKPPIKRGGLMRIFAIAQRLRARCLDDSQRGRERSCVRLKCLGKMRCDGSIVRCCPRKHFRCKFSAQFKRGASGLPDLPRDLRVIRRIHDHRHTFVSNFSPRCAASKIQAMMSIFSMASCNETPALATVCSNG